MTLLRANSMDILNIKWDIICVNRCHFYFWVCEHWQFTQPKARLDFSTVHCTEGLQAQPCRVLKASSGKRRSNPSSAEPLSVPPWLRSNPAKRTNSLQEAAWRWAWSQSCLWKCSAEQQWCVEALLWNSWGWGGGFGRSIIYIAHTASRTCGTMYLLSHLTLHVGT